MAVLCIAALFSSGGHFRAGGYCPLSNNGGSCMTAVRRCSCQGRVDNLKTNAATNLVHASALPTLCQIRGSLPPFHKANRVQTLKAVVVCRPPGRITATPRARANPARSVALIWDRVFNYIRQILCCFCFAACLHARLASRHARVHPGATISVWFEQPILRA